MSHSHRPAKLNVRALIILVAVTGLLGAGLVAGYYVRKRSLADRSLMQAQAAVQRQDWPAASRHLRQYLEKYPRDAEQLERYAQAQLSVRPLEAGQIAGAIGAYRQLLRLRPGDTEVCRQLARLYAALGEHANAAYVCRQRLAVDPNDTGAALRLARSLTAQNNRPEASALLTRIVEQHPHEIEAYTLLSTLALQDRSDSSHRTAQAWLDRAIDHNRDRAEAALAYVQRAWFRRTISQDMTGARDDLQSAAALAPRDPKVLLLISDEWLAHHEFERSEAALAALRDSDTRAYLEDQVDPEALTYAESLARARCALARGAGETAVAVADQALRELSTRRRIIFLPLAVDLYIAGGRVPQARRCVDEYRAAVQSADSAVTASADDVALLDGIVLSAEGQTNAAIAVLAPLVERNPQLARAWKLLSLAYERTRQYRRSLAALEEYVARQPDPQALVQLACSYRQRDWRKVLKYARQAEQAGADEVDARVLRIEARLRSALGTLGPVQRAQLADELADLRIEHPRRGDVRMLQSALLLQSGKEQEAVDGLRQALAECDQQAACALELARVCQRLHRTDEALQAARQAVAHAPDAALPAVLLSELLTESGQPDEAHDLLRQAAAQLKGPEQMAVRFALAQFMLLHERRPEGIALLRQLAAEYPDDTQLRIELLRLPEVQSDAADADRLIAEIKSIEGERGLLWRTQQARLWLRLPDWKQRAARLGELLSYCVQFDPTWPEPALLLGGMYERLGDVRHAEQTYRRILDTAPDSIEAAGRLLDLLESQRRFAEAEQIIRRAPATLPALSDHRVDVAIGKGDLGPAIAELQQRVSADPQDAAARVVLARLLYQRDRNATAAFRLLDEAARLSPDLRAVVATRASILRAEDRVDEALALLDSEVQQRDDASAYRMRAEFFALIGRLEQAEQDYQHLTALADGAAAGYAALGSFYQQQHRPDDAIAAWEAGLVRAPDDLELKRLLVRAVLPSTDAAARQRGRTLLEDLLRELPDDIELLALRAATLLAEGTPAALESAEPLLQRVVLSNPHHVAAYTQLIQLARRRGNLDQAAALAARALAENAGNPELRLLSAGVESERNNISAARDLARSVAETNPQNAAARNLLAELALRSSDLDTAERMSAEARQLDPGNEMAQLTWAKILEARGRRPDAIQALQSYLQSEAGRRSVVAFLALASLHRLDRNFDAAGTCIDRADRIEPHSNPVLSARLRWLAAQDRYSEIAAALQTPGDVSLQASTLVLGASLLAASQDHAYDREARAVYEQAVALDPKRLDGCLGLAQLAHRLGDLDAAVSAYRQALEQEPYHLPALNALAWILSEDLSRAAEALDLLDKAANFYPDDPQTLDTRGIVLLRLNRLDDARQALERCLQTLDAPRAAPARAATSALAESASSQTAPRSAPAARARALLHLAQVYVRQGQQTLARPRLDEAQQLDHDHQFLNEKERAEMTRLLASAP